MDHEMEAAKAEIEATAQHHGDVQGTAQRDPMPPTMFLDDAGVHPPDLDLLLELDRRLLALSDPARNGEAAELALACSTFQAHGAEATRGLPPDIKPGAVPLAHSLPLTGRITPNPAITSVITAPPLSNQASGVGLMWGPSSAGAGSADVALGATGMGNMALLPRQASPPPPLTHWGSTVHSSLTTPDGLGHLLQGGGSGGSMLRHLSGHMPGGSTGGPQDPGPLSPSATIASASHDAALGISTKGEGMYTALPPLLPGVRPLASQGADLLAAHAQLLAQLMAAAGPQGLGADLGWAGLLAGLPVTSPAAGSLTYGPSLASSHTTDAGTALDGGGWEGALAGLPLPRTIVAAARPDLGPTGAPQGTGPKRQRPVRRAARQARYRGTGGLGWAEGDDGLLLGADGVDGVEGDADWQADGADSISTDSDHTLSDGAEDDVVVARRRRGSARKRGGSKAKVGGRRTAPRSRKAAPRGDEALKAGDDALGVEGASVVAPDAAGEEATETESTPTGDGDDRPGLGGKPRTSRYRGVTRHRRSGRWEAHIWVKEVGRQVYLGGYEQEEHAAEAYDVAALKTKGPETPINFPVTRYSDLLACMDTITLEELIMAVRRQSQGFSRGTSLYRGVTAHPTGRWESRIGIPGSKHVYLGLFDEEAAAAAAYDRALVRLRGTTAATNFSLSQYRKELAEYHQAQQAVLLQDERMKAIMEGGREFEQWVKLGSAAFEFLAGGLSAHNPSQPATAASGDAPTPTTTAAVPPPAPATVASTPGPETPAAAPRLPPSTAVTPSHASSGPAGAVAGATSSPAPAAAPTAVKRRSGGRRAKNGAADGAGGGGIAGFGAASLAATASPPLTAKQAAAVVVSLAMAAVPPAAVGPAAAPAAGRQEGKTIGPMVPPPPPPPPPPKLDDGNI